MKDLKKYLESDLKDIKRDYSPEFLYYEYYKNKYPTFRLKEPELIYTKSVYPHFVKLSDFLKDNNIYRIKDFMIANKHLSPKFLTTNKAILNYLKYTQPNKYIQRYEKRLCKKLLLYTKTIDYDIIKYIEDKRILLKLKEDKKIIFLIALVLDYIDVKQLKKDLKFLNNRFILYKLFLYRKMINKLKCKNKLINILLKNENVL